MNLKKKCEVVMLPTEKKATDKPFSVGITLCNDDKLRCGNPVGKSEKRQELYFLSEDKIEEGDLIFDVKNKLILTIKFINDGRASVDEYSNVTVSLDICKKIIATTDTTLTTTNMSTPSKIGGFHYKHLPEPSKAFVEKYMKEFNNGNIIKFIFVEYEETFECFKSKTNWTLPKVNKDNEITIKKIRDYLTWKEAELMLSEFICKYCPETSSKLSPGMFINEWISNNIE